MQVLQQASGGPHARPWGLLQIRPTAMQPYKTPRHKHNGRGQAAAGVMVALTAEQRLQHSLASERSANISRIRSVSSNVRAPRTDVLMLKDRLG